MVSFSDPRLTRSSGSLLPRQERRSGCRRDGTRRAGDCPASARESDRRRSHHDTTVAAYSALAIMMAGARPVFADIDPQRLTLDPAAAASAVTARTAAILPVHLYGQPADMPAIAAVAARHSLAIVEDCCQAHLATCEGRPVGSFGAAAAFDSIHKNPRRARRRRRDHDQ